MGVKYSVITGFLGSLSDRFCTYQEDRDLTAKFKLAKTIEGLDGLEVVYPADFDDLEKLKRLLSEYALGVSAVNLNFKKGWNNGSLASDCPETRQKAVKTLQHAMDLAAELGCNLVTTALLNDGYDYMFERDYRKVWDNLVDSVREAASYRDDVRVSFEYKASEPKTHTILADAGKCLYLCDKVGLSNVGVTLDFGHALYAGELPAESVALLAREGRLFYVHLNDNYREWDWDMIPGSVNLWDYLEFLFYLKECGYDSWMAIDVFPKDLDAAKVFATTIRVTKRLMGSLETLPGRDILNLMNGGDICDVIDYLQERMMGKALPRS